MPVFHLTPAAEAAQLRQVTLHLAPFTGEPGGEILAYDYREITKPVSLLGLEALPEWSYAVRLLLGEVGPDRLVNTRWGLLEAIGLLDTVSNRMDPTVWNPDGVPGLRPFPGCGADGDFRTCANPQQYRGLYAERALNPGGTYRNTTLLAQAVDVAMTAWWLHATDLVGDVTNGGTSFIHRCGGAGYGEKTLYCDGNPSTPDIPGATGSTGPMWFKGPKAVGPRTRGGYEYVVTRTLDWVPGQHPTEAGAYARFLWGDGRFRVLSEEELSRDLAELDALFEGKAD